MTAEDPESIVQRALESRTLFDLVEQGRSRAGAAFGFASPTGAGYAYYSTQWIVESAEVAARLYRAAGVPLRTSSATLSVVGLCAPICVESVVTLVALIRMGHTVLLLAPKLASSALERLIEASNCQIIVNGDPSDGYKTVPLVTLEELSVIRNGGINGKILDTEVVRTKLDEPVVMAHSSGTTGQPKLIRKTHKQLLATLRAIPASLHQQSLFMGCAMHWISSIHAALLLGFVRSGSPIFWPVDETWSAESVRDSLVEAKASMVWSSSGLLLAASDTPEGVDALKDCKLVVNTGAVLAPYCAGRLIKAGVRLAVEFGMTELPVSMSSAPWAGDPRTWDYMKPLPPAAGHLYFRPLAKNEGNTWTGGQPLLELVALPSLPNLDKQWANTAEGSVHTGDLFLKHETEERYKCVGRMRDEVDVCRGTAVYVLKSTLYEQVVENRHHETVDAVVLFGDERPEPGILLFMKPGCDDSDEEVVESVWHTAEEEINGVLPLALSRKMLLVVRNASVPRTSKGTIIRPEVFLRFSSLIDAAYDRESNRISA